MARHLLKQVLDKKKITQYKFAEMMGMEPPRISAFMKKDYNPKMAMLVRWKQTLGLKSLDDLVEAGGRTRKAPTKRTKRAK